ncbi:prolyl 4-hydroxylase subunit alpha-1-like isoform X2 [Uloborus diversus]|nr:prolyl 4-hydroxylase subunit alpha-1-like isoform X2 [Uloborus diversus]
MIQYVLVLLLASVVQSDIFSSTAHLQNLLHLERHLVTTLHDYVDRTEVKLNEVKRYLNLFYDSYQEVLEEKVPVPGNGEDMVANPLQAYQLVKRLSVDWNTIRRAMSTDDWLPIRKLTKDYRQLMPGKEDLQGAALALVRLQDTYKLNMTDVARGNILGVPQGTSLTARDLLFLGKQSFNAGYYAHAIRWLDEAMTKARLEGNTTAGVTEILAFQASAVDMHDKLFERTDIDVSDYDTFGYPLNGTLSAHRAALASTRTRKTVKLGNGVSVHDEQLNYMALCRGETLLNPVQESKLKCYHETRKHPFFLLQPLRVEVRSLEPLVVQFHNLLTEGQTDLLRQIAEPKLARSMVQADKGSEVVSVSRTSQNAWVGPKDHPLMARVYKLVESVTGLSTDVDEGHAEIVQIANYGMGGHYTPHFDYLLVDKEPEEIQYVHPKELDAGDRTATLMFYLSDVTRGGATVFPKAGGSVWPKQGSAVFWYNLKKSGGPDTLTLHGACPVAIGSKWVANFWIREKGQIFRRRCELDPEL